jgi:NTP pyrophosphatase (non-canonical NTP hydrolase)
MMRRRKTIQSLQQDALKLVIDLNWQKYHTPENLVLFLFSEVGELGEYCPWTTKTELMKEPLYGSVKEEIADVLKNVIYILNALKYPIPIETLIRKKCELDEIEYPVKKFMGRHRYQVFTKEREYSDPLANLTPLAKDIVSIDKIQTTVWDFAIVRKWDKFYTPASLVLAIAVKTGQIAVAYQKRSHSKEGMQERAIWAMTSIVITLLRLCSFLEIYDLYDVVAEKFKKDRNRFKLSQAHG